MIVRINGKAIIFDNGNEVFEILRGEQIRLRANKRQGTFSFTELDSRKIVADLDFTSIYDDIGDAFASFQEAFDSLVDVVNFNSAGGVGSTAWGAITGALSVQTDLQNALNDKANASALPSFVVVKTLADLPTPAGGLIQLANNKTYIFQGLVNIGTNRLVCGVSNTLWGFDKSDDGVVYTGTASAILCTDKTLSIANLLFSNPAGSTLDVTNTTAYSFQARDCIFASGSAGAINGGNIVALNNNIFANTMSGGVTVQGTVNKLAFSNNFHEGLTGTGTLINIPSGSFKNIEVLSSNFTCGAGVTGLNIGALTYASISNEAGVINANAFDGVGTYVAGINTASDNNWLTVANTGIAPTTTSAECYMTANGTATNIGSTATYFKSAGTTSSSNLSRFSMPANNRLTYLGKKPTSRIVAVAGSISCSNSNQTLRVVISKNGVVVAKSEQEIRISTNNQSVPFIVQSYVDFVENDFIEVFVRNTSSTSSVTVEYLNITI